MGDTKALFGKIATASKEVGGALSADKNNKDQNYDYISADKVLTVAGQALAKQGVVIFPSITSETVEQVTYSSKYGDKSRYDAQIGFAFVITDGETEFNTTWVGRGSDYAVPDKALYKAITSGHKYFLMKLLNIGAGNEDSEHETAEPEQPKARQSAQAKQPMPPAQPDGAAPWAANPQSLLFGGDYNFTSQEEAIAWGMAMGVFQAEPHAKNAYNKLKAEHKPKSATTMWKLWLDDVARRANEAEQTNAA